MNGVIHFKWQIWNDMDDITGSKGCRLLTVFTGAFYCTDPGRHQFAQNSNSYMENLKNARMQEFWPKLLLMLCYSWCNQRSLQVLLKLADCTRKSKFETDRFEKSEMNLTNTLLMFGEMPQTPVNLTPCKWMQMTGCIKTSPPKAQYYDLESVQLHWEIL